MPFVLRWIDDSHIAPLPTAAYGALLFMSATAYLLFERALIAVNGEESQLARAIGVEWKGIGSMLAYAAAIPIAFWDRWVAIAIYVAMAAIWFIPDRRIESTLKA